MMNVFETYSADEAWRLAFSALQDERKSITSSRNGDTVELLRAIIEISDPRQRWIYSRRPTMNPAFALAEVIWIMRGRDDAAFLSHWNKSLPRFVGSDTHLEGAYGRRLRHRRGFDQLARAADVLLNRPDSRQVVLEIWSAEDDLPQADGTPRSEDVPCNIVSLLKVRSGKLEWTQVMRSNDVFRGFPYNVVQFTMLQEILAGWIGVEVGSYVHISDSLHQYQSDSHVMSAPSVAVSSNDSLLLPRNESEEVFLDLEAFAEGLMRSQLKEEGVSQALDALNIPTAFQNFAIILAAEEARRRKWFDMANETLAGCSNEPLQLIARHWHAERKILLTHSSS